MKETIIKLLQERSNEIDSNISKLEYNLIVALKQADNSHQPIGEVRKLLSDLKQQKAETVSCIKWLKNI